MSGLLESILWLDSPARSLRNKDLEIKSLFSFGLERFRCPGWGSGMAGFAFLRLLTPFRPDQKVKLDKSEATRGGSFLRCSPRGMTRVMLAAASRTTASTTLRVTPAKRLNLEAAPIRSLSSSLRTMGLKSMDFEHG